MEAVCSLFDESELLIVRSHPREGGLPLPKGTRVTALREPRGEGFKRKLDVILSLPYYLSEVLRHVRKADVVHMPLPGDIPVLALVVALACRKPVIARYGGSWASTSVTTLMNRVTRGFMRWFAGGRNVMLAAGEGEIPPAPNVEWLFSTAVSRAELENIQPHYDRTLSTPPRIVYAGRLSIEKGVANLIRAVAILKKRGVPVIPVVTLLGDGPLRRQLEELADTLGCKDLVHFAGQVNRERLSHYLSDSDFAVQPSYTESLGKAWLDELAHGLPIVISDVGSAESVVGENGFRGWRVPAGDVEALANTIHEVVSVPRDWPALRRRCREYAESRTIEVWTERIARRCMAQWHCSFRHGKLTYVTSGCLS
jgi:hypothetical protein